MGVKVELGERRIIELIQEQLDKMPHMPVPFGDDVSAYELGRGELAILKADMLVGKTDVPIGMSLRQAARKAVVMNISDLAAKGAQPLAVMVSLGLTREMSVTAVKEIGQGLNEGAREYGTYVVGGDTGEASDLIISVSVFGKARKNRIMLRSGARPGDLLAVTGLFGKTTAGLKILSHHRDIQPDEKIGKTMIDSVLTPRARLNEGLALSETRAVTASVDSSDGLAWSLHEIARNSRVGFVLDKLPTAPEAEEFATTHGLDADELTLYGGEEYELVITVKPELWEKAAGAIGACGGTLYQIGRVTSTRKVVLRTREKSLKIERRGWEHFRNMNLKS